MRFVRYWPASPLDACVDCFWWSKRDRAEPASERMLPSGTAQLIFALHESPVGCSQPTSTARPLVWSRSIVHGPQWSYYEAGAKPAGAIVGVSFRPGAAGALLGAPITDFTDRHVTLDAMWGHRSEELREQLLAAGYSPRHFVALFRAAGGLTPKHFYRIKRFSTVLHRLADGNPESLVDLAGAAGYSDQAHLSREFREFAGITPTQYRPRSRESVFHQRSVADAGSAGKKSSRLPFRHAGQWVDTQ